MPFRKPVNAAAAFTSGQLLRAADNSSDCTTAAGVPGITNGSNASAGLVGEILRQLIDGAHEVSLSSSTWTNVATITLTPGDWDVSGVVSFDLSATNVATTQVVAISSTSATPPTIGTELRIGGVIPSTTQDDSSIACGPGQFNVNANTQIWLMCFIAFTGVGATSAAYGVIRARRCTPA